MKLHVNDINETLSELLSELQSMRRTANSHYDQICQLNRASQRQLKELMALRKENAELRRRLSQYEEPSKNSGNSSVPPSKENMKDESARLTKSLRKASGKKPGGQHGHEGNTLKKTDAPDSVSDIMPDKCDACGDSLENCVTVLDYITQIVSLPELRPVIN